ncbi:MAG: hypothetical protein WCL39_10050, partial [Armatimonadota bacterium]
MLKDDGNELRCIKSQRWAVERAVRDGDLYAILRLVYGLEPDARLCVLESALLQPILSPLIAETLIRAGARLDVRDIETDGTVLHVHHSADVLECLLAWGCDPGAVDSQSATPLHVLVERPAAIEVLLSHGACPNSRNMRDETPLHEAVTCIVPVLKSQADPDRVLVESARQSLVAALRTAYARSVALLLREGADAA